MPEEYSFVRTIVANKNRIVAMLTAALSDNEAKDAQLGYANEQFRRALELLDIASRESAAKDARIAELEALIPGFVYGKSMLVPIGSAGDLVAMNNRAEAAEAKLTAVEGVKTPSYERYRELLRTEYLQFPDRVIK